MISYKGKLAVAVAIPIVAQLLGAIDIPGMTAQVAALAQLVVNFKPPTVAASVTFALNLLAQAQATVSYPVLQISAELVAKLALLKARLELVIKITDLLAGGSVRVYEYEGAAGNFGAELGATLAGPEASGGVAPSRATFAVVLLAEGGTAGETTLKILRSGA